MPMRKRVGSVLFTAAAAAAIVGLSVGPALASTHLTVRVSHGGSYTATAKPTVLTDNGISVHCNSSKGSGKLPNGTHRGVAPVRIGTVAKLSFNGCTGLALTVTTKVESKPTLEANSKTNRKGQTDAIITGVKVHVSMTSCSFDVTGSAPGFYSNRTHILTMTSKKLPARAVKKAQLTVSNVVGCSGIVNNNDHPQFNASYKVSRAITIKSS